MSAPPGCAGLTWRVGLLQLLLPRMTTYEVNGEAGCCWCGSWTMKLGCWVVLRRITWLVRVLTPEGICRVCCCCWWENYITHFLLLDLEKVKDILQTYLPVSSLGKHTISLFILSTRNIHCLMSMLDTKMVYLLKVTLVEPVVMYSCLETAVLGGNT